MQNNWIACGKKSDAEAMNLRGVMTAGVTRDVCDALV
jgi:hypothetical protein